MEDIFFCIYNLKMSRSEALNTPIYERKWLMNRYATQKDREHESFEAERRKAKRK